MHVNWFLDLPQSEKKEEWDSFSLREKETSIQVNEDR
jgi:hypothetical protein